MLTFPHGTGEAKLTTTHTHTQRLVRSRRGASLIAITTRLLSPRPILHKVRLNSFIAISVPEARDREVRRVFI